MVPSQTPPTGRIGLTTDISARGPASSSITNPIPQSRQPLPQGAMVPSQSLQSNQNGLSRPANAASDDMSSAPMPHQQLHNQGRQPQQHANQHQLDQSWPHQGQPAPQQRSPHLTSVYQQQRPVNGSPGVNGPARVLPSQVPVLASNHFGPMRTKPAVARASSGGHLGMSDSTTHSNRVPLPSINAPPMSSRDERFQAHNARNMSQLPTPRPEDMARQAMDIQRLAKRKSDASEVSVRDTDLKRARIDAPHSIAPRTITFKEVYQDGKAEYKHNIVKYDDVFYILRCDEHGVHFKQNALAAAAKHLHGASHGHQRKEHKLAVETLGFHVVDCTEELAALNNECVRRAFQNGYKPLNQLHGPKSGGKRLSVGASVGAAAEVDVAGERVVSASQSPIQTAAQVVELQDANGQDEKEEEARQQARQETKQQVSALTKNILNPKAGELYHAKWPRSNNLYTVMVLGWTDLKMCGWEEKLSQTQLCDRKIRPACYVYNDDGIAGWAPGFEDGEDRVLERDIPVLWFESKGKTRLGWLGIKWLLGPMVLDDPNRPADPDHPSNQARKWYADIRGYDSFEAMLVSSGAEGAVPTKVPSSASASDSDSIPDVDMYDFGDNPPPVDDSDDEDYVERTSHKDKELEEEMVDAEPQPLRRSTQEVRPTLRLGESSWLSGRLEAAAGTRLSAQKDMPATVGSDDVTMEDASQATSSKSYVTGDETPNTTGVNGGLLSLALGTPASPISESAVMVGLSQSATRTNDGASKSVASPDSMRDPGGRAAISEPSTRVNSSQRLNEQESARMDSRKDLQHGETESRLGHAAMANLAQSAVKAASKSPSLSMEAPQISPALNVADLLNDATTPEKVVGQPLVFTQDKPAGARRPLPSGSVPNSRSSGVAVIQPTARKHPVPHKPTLGPISSQREGVSQQPSPALSVQSNGNKEETPGMQPPRCGSAGSAESMPRRPDPRMSISNAVEDDGGDRIRRTELSVPEKDHGPGSGISSGNNTPRVLTHISLANDARWRAVRASESPCMSPVMMPSPGVDRSAAASPALDGNREMDKTIDVAEFYEGDKHWAREGEFLQFILEGESGSVAKTKKEDGIEVTVDPCLVKAAHMTGSEVRLILKTGGDQRFVFSGNTLTGSHRGAKLQMTKFYRWVTANNADIEHIG
ncbi:uncharacterized protein LY79DRAFT_521798 [Colletotrichum navitas]|uniref:Uncharacterized protein n=1 Tax=Colletotrichum navitas TaxID=681940 RepID=A0AAD8V1F3_9PEZI|nr:uncharacterized protein LY79DRAFT_521798 [Colletotrichum navitas]KAK1579921.1 hypothetical protein LY79DRAFT_521798 [Colletotrichum navitas]